jgi:uncharacterized protein
LIIDVHVHPHISRSLDEFQPQIEIAERYDVTLITYAVRPPGATGNHSFPTPDYLRACNDLTYELMQRHPSRVRGFCYVNPGHPQAAREELEFRLSKQGFCGLKLWIAVPCDDPRLDRLVEICQHYHVPALQHTWHKAMGNSAGESDPTMVATLARRHPQATIIAAHSGGDYEYGAKVFRNCPNVLLDIAGSECSAGYLEILVDHAGEDRVIFGTDMPGRSFTSQLAKVTGADLSDRVKEKILYKTMAGVLGDRL